MLSAFVNFFLRRYLWFLAILTLITIPCTYWTARLYGNLKPDMEELLPRKSRAILDLDEIRSRLLSIQKLNIIVYSQKNPEGARKFTEDLAAKLSVLPKDEVAGVEYRIDREIKFFNDRKALFLELPDLISIRNYIRDRIDYEKRLYNPLNIFSEVDIPEPNLDFKGIQKKYSSQSSGYDHFPGGYYATPDGKKRLVMVYLPANRGGVNGVQDFKKQIAAVVDSVNKPGAYASDLIIRYSGPVQDIIEEYTALVDDIETSAEVVFSIVLVALVIYFRSFLATGALLAALFMARFWSFGMAWFVVGSLNANSAFMGSIVLGSGITYGVMLLARYLEERRNGRSPLRAARTAMTATARATWTAALCTGFSYGALFLTEFEGFRQYGIIGLIGMLLCWVGSILVLPALLLLIERFRPLVKKGAQGKRRAWIFGPLTWALGKYPHVFLGVSVLLTVFSLVELSKFNTDNILEKNLAALRNKESMEKGSGFWGRDVDEIMQSGSSPVVALAHSNKSADEIARRLKAQWKKEGDASLIRGVATLRSFVPEGQPEKIRMLLEVNRLLPGWIRNKLSPEDRSKVKELLDPSGFKLIREEALPDLVREKFTEKSGAVGNLVLVDPRDDSSNWSGFQLNDFVGGIRKTADEVEGRIVPVAGTITVTSDMIASIIRDGPKATAFAFASVVLLITLLFRKPKTIGLMLSTLVLGVIWMFGLMMAKNIKINFLNFIALPITFGIGVDYGVNLIDRYMHDPDRDILKVVRETGGAVGLCSFTTIIGYCSLLIARNQAFVSFGLIAVLGEVMCVGAAIIALPAAFLVFGKKQSKH